MINANKPLDDLIRSGEKKGLDMRAKFLSISLLAGMFAILVQCAVANAVSITTAPETESFNLATTPTVTFEVKTGSQLPPIPPVNTNNSPVINSSILTFDKFDTSLGTLTGVSITFTTTYGATVTLSVTNDELFDLPPPPPDPFFADATIGHELTGSLISTMSSPQTLSATCAGDEGAGDLDTSDCSASQSSNNNAFNGTAGLAAALTSFNGPGTFDLTATLTSALSPRPREFVDNSTGTLQANWNGSVSVVYTYDNGVAAVPEPLSVYLLAAGLGGIALSRRRRR